MSLQLKRSHVLIIAVVSGLLTVILLFMYIQNFKAKLQPVSVAVAIADIPAGTILEDPTKYLAVMQAKVLPGGNTNLLQLRYPISEEADLLRMRDLSIRRAIPRGGVILVEDVVGSEGLDVYADLVLRSEGLPGGNPDAAGRTGERLADYRAITFPVKNSRVGSFVRPGDVVDLVQIIRREDGVREARVLLYKVQLVAVNGRTGYGERIEARASGPVASATAVLCAEDAMKLYLAMNVSEIGFLLRSPRSSAVGDMPSIDENALMVDVPETGTSR